MADVSRPERSRYAWSDDDDTEVAATDVAMTSSSLAGDEAATERDLDIEVKALEEAERAGHHERALARTQDARARSRADWSDDDRVDLEAADVEPGPLEAYVRRRDTGRRAPASDGANGADAVDGDAVNGADAVDGDAVDGEATADGEAADADAAESDAPTTSAETPPDAAPPVPVDGDLEVAPPTPTAKDLARMADMGPTPVDRSHVPLREYSDIVYTFEPNTKQLPPIREYFTELWARRRFMVELARSQSRGNRSSTVLGELWAVIDPLFQVALYWFLLSIIRGGQGGMGDQDLSQRLVMMVGGIFLFSLSSTTITSGGRSILAGKNLMLNSTFPRALLPLSAAYKAITEFVPTIFIYLVFHVAFGQSFGMGFFMLPLLFVIQMAMAIGLGMIFATLTVFLRDTQNILSYIMRVLFFSTPVIYPASAIPDSLHKFLLLNPLLGLFTAYQDIIAGGVPSLVDVAAAAAWATLFLVVGYRLFVSNERSFALRL